MTSHYRDIGPVKGPLASQSYVRETPGYSDRMTCRKSYKGPVASQLLSQMQFTSGFGCMMHSVGCGVDNGYGVVVAGNVAACLSAPTTTSTRAHFRRYESRRILIYVVVVCSSSRSSGDSCHHRHQPLLLHVDRCRPPRSGGSAGNAYTTAATATVASAASAQGLSFLIAAVRQ